MSFSRRFRGASFALLLLAPFGTGAEELASADRSTLAVDKFLADALLAGLEGDDSGRRQKLAAARKTHPESAIVQWHSGLVRVGDDWKTAVQVAELSQSSELLKSYFVQRAKSADSAEGAARLAAWCQRNGLADQARAHWYQVLRRQPNDRRALRALDARWYRGALLENEAADEQQRRDDRLKREINSLATKTRKLRRSVVRGGEAERSAAIAEVRKIDGRLGVIVVTAVLLKPTDDADQTAMLQAEAMCILGSMDVPESVRILAWHASMSPHGRVRAAARHQLGQRPRREVIPMLLVGMAMPLDAAVTTQVQGQQTVTTLAIEREGPAGKSYQNHLTAYQKIPGNRYRAFDFGTFNRVWKERPLVNM